MAIMGRAKKAKGQGWNATNMKRAEENRPKELEKKEISDEEHEKRIKHFKKLGLIKE